MQAHTRDIKEQRLRARTLAQRTAHEIGADVTEQRLRERDEMIKGR